jgi:CRP/FNR family transcriptional regulator
MSRLDMADYLGLKIETVSRMMTSLVRRGLIQATGRHRIALSKLSVLRDIVGRDEDEADTQPAPVRRAVWPD